MGQDSKRKRYLRQLKRRLSLQGRTNNQREQIAIYQQQVQALQAQSFYTKTMLMAILGQQGGEIEITQGTYKQAMENIQCLSYIVGPKKDDAQVMVVRLVEESTDDGESGREQTATTPAFTIRKVEDEPIGLDSGVTGPLETPIDEIVEFTQEQYDSIKRQTK